MTGKKSNLKLFFLNLSKLIIIHYILSNGLIALSIKLIYFSEEYQNKDNKNSTNKKVLNNIVDNIKKGG